MQNLLSTIIFSLLFIVLFVEGTHYMKKIGKPKTDENEISWEDYKAKFGKHYKNKDQDLAHKQAFFESQKFVREHNAKHSRGEKNYRTGLSHLADLLPEEFDGMRGHLTLTSSTSTGSETDNTIDNTDDDNFMGCSVYVPDSTAVIPASVDWRTKGYVTPVKNQGQCGSCYSFAATGALEGALKRKTGTLTSLSEQNIVDCDKNDGGCDGGNAAIVFAYVKSNGGINSEATYPYSANTQENGVAGTCAFNKAKVAGKDTGCVAIQSMDETALKNAVATQGPITVAIDANITSFLHFASDAVFDGDECADTDTDHAVLIVGYGTDSTGKDYWIVKNSWDTTWGDQGYIKIARGKNCLGIAQEAVFPVV